jgi:hypothetical protein
VRQRSAALVACCFTFLLAAACAHQNRVPPATAAQSDTPPTPSVCLDAGNCQAPSDLGCRNSDGDPLWNARTILADYADGVSSDGRGPYSTGPGSHGPMPATLVSVVGFEAVMGSRVPRSFKVNLSKPVPRGGGRPLGVVVDSGGTTPDGKPTGFAIFATLRVIDHVNQNFKNIPVGGSAPAAQLNVFFHINGRFHILQMGPQPWLVCHTKTPPVSGNGTTAAIIYRPDSTRWVVDLPAGSIGRLYDVSGLSRATPFGVIDRGLYYIHLHYEIGP